MTSWLDDARGDKHPDPHLAELWWRYVDGELQWKSGWLWWARMPPGHQSHLPNIEAETEERLVLWIALQLNPSE